MLTGKTLLRITVICSILSYSLQWNQMVKLDRFDVCYTKKNGPMKLNIVISGFNKSVGSVLNGEVEFKRDMATIKLLIDVKRCANRESLDTCEDFGNLNPSNTCTFLILNNMTWTPFVQSMKPALKCPIKAGKYIMTNGAFDPTLFHVFPLARWYWKINYRIYEGKTLLLAVCTEFRIVNSIKSH